MSEALKTAITRLSTSGLSMQQMQDLNTIVTVCGNELQKSNVTVQKCIDNAEMAVLKLSTVDTPVQ